MAQLRDTVDLLQRRQEKLGADQAQVAEWGAEGGRGTARRGRRAGT